MVFTLLDHLCSHLCSSNIQSTSENTGKLIAKAIVQVLGSEIQTLTDTEGNYSLSDLQAGKPTVQVSATGFATATRQVTLTAVKEESADVKLEPKLAFFE